MIRAPSVTALTKHGYGIGQVKRWREEQNQAGKPSTLDDFCRAHGLCIHCGAEGKNIVGVRWRDLQGTEHTRQLATEGAAPETVASIYEQELKNAAHWDYLYTACTSCGGTGKANS
jgi:hypothetical protein